MNSKQESTKRSLLDPPVCVSGMKELNRCKFSKTIQITCLKAESKDLKSILKFIKPYLLKKQNLLPVIKLDDKQSHIRLNPDKSEELVSTEKFTKLVEEHRIVVEEQELQLHYDNFSCHEILRSVLSKDDLGGLSSYSVIGHIIHLNLRDEYEPYRQLIGQVLLDKNPSQSLVLNKTDKIDTTFRYFSFDVLARRDESVSTIVQVNENGFKFKMDFAKVYWNPRLSTEHDRIIDLLDRGDIVYDVFAGIGPFAVPASKKKNCIVFANDLNPESYNYLNENMKLNKVERSTTYNLDGREFIAEVIRDNLIDNWMKLSALNEESTNGQSTSKRPQFHVIMNLPAIAVEFLDAFIGLTTDKLDDETISDLYRNDKLALPNVYCYCFHQADLDKTEMIGNVKRRLNYDAIDKVDLFFIRKVAPNKDMYRITFRLPKEVLFAQKPNKRQKTE